MLHYTFKNNQCSRKFILSKLEGLIKSPKTNGRYLSILVQLNTRDNDIVNLGGFVCVDRLNPISIGLCKFYFDLRYNEDILNNKLEISSLIISSKEIEKEEYLNYIRDFYRDSN